MSHPALIPAQAGTQRGKTSASSFLHWIPAVAGTIGQWANGAAESSP